MLKTWSSSKWFTYDFHSFTLFYSTRIFFAFEIFLRSSLEMEGMRREEDPCWVEHLLLGVTSQVSWLTDLDPNGIMECGEIAPNNRISDSTLHSLPVSISSTFYEQLLRLQTPKAQKKTVKSSSFSALLGSASVKAARRMLVKLTPRPGDW